MTSPPSIADRVAARDPTLFDRIPAELTANDRAMLLALQDIVARRHGSYRYLEIGSHKGGSIQPHLLDARCASIVSIDPRPLLQPDERGARFGYPENSTEAMMALLRALAPGETGKIATYETTADELAKRGIGTGAADLVLIDGEHTDQAASLDFRAVRKLARDGAVIVFHDAPIVYRAIAGEIDLLLSQGAEVLILPLPDTLFVVVVGPSDLIAPDDVAMLATEAGRAYLTALRLNSRYRDFYRLMPFRLVRSVFERLGLRRLASAYEYGAAGGDRR